MIALCRAIRRETRFAKLIKIGLMCHIEKWVAIGVGCFYIELKVSIFGEFVFLFQSRTLDYRGTISRNFTVGDIVLWQAYQLCTGFIAIIGIVQIGTVADGVYRGQ